MQQSKLIFFDPPSTGKTTVWINTTKNHLEAGGLAAYRDYECPMCQAGFPTVHKMLLPIMRILNRKRYKKIIRNHRSKFRLKD